MLSAPVTVLRAPLQLQRPFCPAGIDPRGHLLWALLLSFPAFSTSQPLNTDPAFIKQILDEHNKYRAEVSPTAADMLYMTWNTELSNDAVSWSKQCNAESYGPDVHHRAGATGGNMWVGPPSSNISAVKTWNEESAHYTYATNECSGDCSHYTQVVWATHYKVGCATALCKTVKGNPGINVMMLLCYYGPGLGSFSQPYTEGDPCSKCPDGDRCERNLCRNSKREASSGNSKHSRCLDLLLCLSLFNCFFTLFYFF
ncbi:GLIPR1-like protein 1 [Ambystoma mexicanum]|uniref:GLIPR1-like protein 1 n=1 Tax=Ambystoma mexicanum TaxID=8296 RepID=UPI0037E9A762